MSRRSPKVGHNGPECTGEIREETTVTYRHIRVERAGAHALLTMDRAERRNTLSREAMEEMIDAFREIGRSDARGVILAGAGPVFSAGHDFGDMTDAGLAEMRTLLRTCTTLMETILSVPQVVIARVHGLAVAAGCQLVATCDLAVAAHTATFALPGGKAGWFCHTPTVAVTRAVGRKRALEMSFTGDPIDAATAADWGLVNRVVPAADLERETLALLDRATRGTRESKGMAKQGFYAQVDLPLPQAYAYASELMASSSQVPDAREGVTAFFEKRRPDYGDR
jgi:enoyl-CoA hydratase/carnithine racemase